jgi:hypothetical protein
MTINARYIDTCFSDYLQDHHNRPGECLVGAYLGGTIESAFDDMLNDVNVPDHIDQDEIAHAVRGALEGVDLRPFDEHGNRLDVIPDDYEGGESQVWVLLTWAYPEEDWQHEVANGDTRLGYQEWRAHQIEAARST